MSLLAAGCGGAAMTASQANSVFSVAPGPSTIDTNCTGCNAANARGAAVHQFKAMLNNGGAADVSWSVSGGDLTSGAGKINASGQYAPPAYLTADRVQVQVTAALKSDPTIRATSLLTLTPGFLQPLTPENVALGANGTVTVSATLAEAGGGASVRFALADTPTGASGGSGFLSQPICQRDERAFTSCTVTYTAPPVVAATGVTYVVATAGASTGKTETAVLLNPEGVTSNPATHQAEFLTPILLGTSGGNNNDYDAQGNKIADCCGGTLGALIQDGNGKQYMLSNNHVLARSDHAAVGDDIVQPGLIDNNCTPNGDGAGTQPVGVLTGWLPLSANQTNADAAIAEAASHSVDAQGRIQELGVRQPDGSLAPAPLGVSSSSGKGEQAALALRVAKSGRTTGLTCGSVSAMDVDISVDYYTDCAESRSYLTKTYTNQIAVSGNHLSDAGDSGSVLVDTENAEPVGLFFAGGTDALGVGQGMANPVGDVLSELSSQVGNGANYTFVGGADHPVSCLSFGDNTVLAAQSQALSSTENDRAERALNAARLLVNPTAGILGVSTGKSSDHAGEAAVIVYVDDALSPVVPASVSGVRTVVIPTTAHAVEVGAAPVMISQADAPALPATTLTNAVATKQQIAHGLMQHNAAYFGMGVGQSLDNPREAALVIYVDRKQVPADLPQTISGLRTRYVVMDRLHVTRSYAVPFASRSRCMLNSSTSTSISAPAPFDPAEALRPRTLPLD
jgi:hypothetical protein